LANTTLIGFGGGCHWCTEAVFNSLKGVEQVTQGFIKSTPPADALSEAVQLQFNPNEIPLAVLVEIHLRTHASTSNHSFREKYRSAIYLQSDTAANDLHDEVVLILKQLQDQFDKPLVTQVLPLLEFVASPEQYQQYYQKHANGEFCQRYVDTKLTLIREQYAKHYDRSRSVPTGLKPN